MLCFPANRCGVQDMDRFYALIRDSFGAETADDIFWRNALNFFSRLSPAA